MNSKGYAVKDAFDVNAAAASVGAVANHTDPSVAEVYGFAKMHGLDGYVLTVKAEPEGLTVQWEAWRESRAPDEDPLRLSARVSGVLLADLDRTVRNMLLHARETIRRSPLLSQPPP